MSGEFVTVNSADRMSHWRNVNYERGFEPICPGLTFSPVAMINGDKMSGVLVMGLPRLT